MEGPTSPPLGERLEAWQERDFAALDPAWSELAGLVDRGSIGTEIRRAWIERPRGHAKTSDMAAQLLWILEYGRLPVRGLAAAADRDQAGLIRTAMWNLAERNRELIRDVVFRQHGAVNPRTGSLLEVLASEVAGSWGKLPDFVVCDELCHWEKPDLWHSLFSSAAKRPRSLLAVLTNAGTGRGWQWELREAARTSPLWYFSTLPGPAAPWLDAAQLAEQERLLPRTVYDRLWRNVWQEGGGEFVTRAEARACRDEALVERDRGEHGRRYFAAVDYAEKRDHTVGVLVHREGSRLVVDRMDVVVPGPSRPTPVRWVEDWMAWVAKRFEPVSFVVDEYQLLGTIQRLQGRHDVRRFEFQSGLGNHALALALRQAIVERELAWYAGCGEGRRLGEFAQAWGTAEFDTHGNGTAVDGSGGSLGTGPRDLEEELATVILRQAATGRVRIDHRQDGVHHDDRVFALGAACLTARREGEGGEWMSVEGGW